MTNAGKTWAAQPPATDLFKNDEGTRALRLDLPQLQYEGQWRPRPGVMQSLGTALRLRTRLEPERLPSVVRLTDDELFRTPFLYVAGQESFPLPQAAEIARLRRFVDLGGLLVFDDAEGGSGRGFRNDVMALVRSLLPGSELAPVGEEHVLFRSFYIVKRPTGRTVFSDHVLAVQEEGRLKILYLPNDLGGALARGPDERYLLSCHPGGEVQREWAIRFGVNIMLYATCTDYKSDPAHVETLLRRREWR